MKYVFSHNNLIIYFAQFDISQVYQPHFLCTVYFLSFYFSLTSGRRSIHEVQRQVQHVQTEINEYFIQCSNSVTDWKSAGWKWTDEQAYEQVNEQLYEQIYIHSYMNRYIHFKGSHTLILNVTLFVKSSICSFL